MERPRKWINKGRDFVSHKIDSSRLAQGDHIYSYRRLGTYSHHGIFVGGTGNFVIHFTSTQKGKAKPPCEKCPPNQSNIPVGVVKTCLDCFLREGTRTEEDENSQRSVHQQHSVRLYYYGVPSSQYKLSNRGTCSTEKCKPAKEVVTTAEEYFTKERDFGEYNLKCNNCEHFATLCKTGESFSTQAERRITKLTKLINFSSH